MGTAMKVLQMIAWRDGIVALTDHYGLFFLYRNERDNWTWVRLPMPSVE